MTTSWRRARSARSALLGALLMLGPPAAHAAAVQTLNMTVGLSAYYDDNILQYSREQIRLFENTAAPLQFSIRKRDDLVWNPSVALAWELAPRRDRRHGVRLRTDGKFHQENETVDYHSLSISWREWFPDERRLAFSYYDLPHYYLRQLLNLDDPVLASYPGLARSWYRRAEFGLRIGSVEWTQRIHRRTRLETSYQYERRRYDSEFRERDSDTHQGEIGMVWTRLPHRGTVGLRAGYHASDARAGFYLDPRGGNRTPYADVGYHGVVAGADATIELARRGPVRIGVDLGYDLETRAFDSSESADRFHFGRDDVLNVVEVGLRAALRPHWSMRGFYRLEDNRAAFGTSLSSSVDPGSYRVNRAGLAAEWSGALWRSAVATGETGDAP